MPETFEEFIQEMIQDGYWSEKDLKPLKCHHCDSDNLEDKNHSYCQFGVVEYERYCKDCNKQVGNWAYGNWMI